MLICALGHCLSTKNMQIFPLNSGQWSGLERDQVGLKPMEMCTQEAMLEFASGSKMKQQHRGKPQLHSQSVQLCLGPTIISWRDHTFCPAPYRERPGKAQLLASGWGPFTSCFRNFSSVFPSTHVSLSTAVGKLDSIHL